MSEVAIKTEDQITANSVSDAFVFFGGPEISLAKKSSRPCTTWCDTEP